MKFTVHVARRTYEIEVDHDHLVRVNGHPVYVDLEQIGTLPIFAVALEDTSYLAFVEQVEGTYRVEVAGRVYPTEVQVGRPALPRPDIQRREGDNGCLEVRAPLPGKLVSIPLSAGERVEAGQTVAVVESMKMQMELKAPRSGVVLAVHGPEGRVVAQDESLVALQEEQSAGSSEMGRLGLTGGSPA